MTDVLYDLGNLGSPIGREVLTPASATGITPARLVNSNQQHANVALIRVEAKPVRFTIDGQAPTASVGILLPVDALVILRGEDLISALKFMDTAGGASSVTVQSFLSYGAN